MNNLDLNLLLKYCDHSPMCYQKHPFADLYIFGYYRENKKYRYNKWDNVNKISRGLIVNSQGDIIEHPFPKFWTFRQYLSNELILLSENQTKKLTCKPKAVYEKLDGTMGVLYWVDDIPYIATQRSFTNAKAIKGTKILHEKYKHLFDQFDRNLTYIFEIIYPETQIIVNYSKEEKLVLIGVFEKKSGKSLPIEFINLEIQKTKNYIDVFKEYADNLAKLESLDISGEEGFVVVFEDDSRVKLKFPTFKGKHERLSKLLLDRKNLAYTEYDVFPERFTTIFKREDVAKLSKSKKSEILENTPYLYKMFGFEYWLMGAEDKNEIPNLNKLIDNEFDIEKVVKEPHIYDTQNWKWKEIK